MNVDWYFRIPLRVRVLAILLVLAFGLVVSWRPFVEWYKCGGLDLMSFEPLDYEGPVVWVGFRQYSRGWTLRSLSPEWTPDGAHIVFVAEAARKEFTRDERKIMSRVHVVGGDGSNLRTISDESREYVRDHSPSVSPDGTRVAYSVYNRVSDNKIYEEIVTTALDGSERRRLTHKVGLDRESEWLPDGDRIAFRRDSTSSCASRDFSIGGIHTVKSDGSTVRRVLSFKKEFGIHFALTGNTSWSPDKRTVAFFVEELLPEREHDSSASFSYSIYFRRTSFVIVDVHDSTMTRLIVGEKRLHGTGTKPSSFGGSSAWSPVGARIAFFLVVDDVVEDERKVSLITIDPESGEFSKVADLPIGGSLSWSPDGSQIMVSNGRGTVYLVQADGTDVRLFSDIDASDVSGGLYTAWSPDGSRVAVVVPESSGVVLATVAPDGSDARALVRRGENGALEAVGAAQHEDGPIDVVGCARTMEPVYCLQVMNDRLVVSSTMCALAFWENAVAQNPGRAHDCEALWAIRRWATEIRQPSQLERTSREERAPISDLSDIEEGAVFDYSPWGLRVVELSLEGWNLTGPISGRLATELAKLTALESVDLSGNRLSGCIPEELRGKVIGYEEPEGCEG